MSDILKMNAVGQLAEMRAGRLSAEALMQAALARIAEINPKLNAIVSLRDAADLLAEARAADQATQRGALHGLPIAIKDLVDVAGLPTSGGSPALAGDPATHDAPHVARLRAAGAIVIGKTNTPEFGLGSHTYNPVHGITRNPYDPSRSCGGSSGGAAVALASGMVSIADGSDMMGSLRNPAGYCNVYGLRPTQGRVPDTPSEAEPWDQVWSKLATNGPMARSPKDLALLLGVMTDEPGADLLNVAIKGKKIGWLADWGGALPCEPGILRQCTSALDVFTGLGAVVTPVAAPFSRDALWLSWITLRSKSIAAALGPLYDDVATRALLKPEAIWEIEHGRSLSARAVENAARIREDWIGIATALLQRHDALALPTAQVWPFKVEQTWPRNVAGAQMDTYHRWMECVIPVSLIGLPAVAIPAGFGAGGLPMGLQLAGAYGDDRGVLEMAEGYHRATEWPGRKPPPI